jgi:hypothetical protein
LTPLASKLGLLLKKDVPTPSRISANTMVARKQQGPDPKLVTMLVSAFDKGRNRQKIEAALNEVFQAPSIPSAVEASKKLVPLLGLVASSEDGPEALMSALLKGIHKPNTLVQFGPTFTLTKDGATQLGGVVSVNAGSQGGYFKYGENPFLPNSTAVSAGYFSEL